VKAVRWQDVAPDTRRGGDIRVLLGPSTTGATSGLMGVLTLEPGRYVAEHYHPFSEKFVHVTSGTVVVRLDLDDVAVSADEAILVPTGVRHRIENRSGAPAVCVFFLSPLAPHPNLGHVDTEALPDPDEPARRSGTP
jgi:putative monooxygenase